MKPFIKAKTSREASRKGVIDLFIDVFNSKLAKGEFSINTGLDKVNYLTPEEFENVKTHALNCGYKLTHFEDNYNTDTYKLEPI